MSNIEETLKERSNSYADFRDNAVVAQELKEAMRRASGWNDLPAYVKEGFDMVASKISRAVTGDPLHIDNFHDIIGYGKLMEDRATKDREVRDGVQMEIRTYEDPPRSDFADASFKTALANAIDILEGLGFKPTVSGTMIDENGLPPYRVMQRLMEGSK